MCVVLVGTRRDRCVVALIYSVVPCLGAGIILCEAIVVKAYRAL